MYCAKSCSAIFLSVDSLVSFVTGNQLATGPINWRIIITKCPPGIVFIFTIVLTESQSNNSFLRTIPYCISVLKTLLFDII